MVQKSRHYEKIQKVVENDSTKKAFRKRTTKPKVTKPGKDSYTGMHCSVSKQLHNLLEAEVVHLPQVPGGGYEEGEKSHQMKAWENFLFTLNTNITLSLHIGLFSFDFLSLVRDG